MNPDQTLDDVDFIIVNSCQPVNVNTVVHESDGEMGHEASVLMKHGGNTTKGKKTAFKN